MTDFLLSCIEAKAKPGSVHTLRAVLSAILNAAVDDDLIIKNPASKAGKDLPPAERRKVCLTPEQTETLLVDLKANDPEAYLPVLLTSRGGVRIGETLGLAWSDVNLDDAVLTVRRTVSKGNEGPTKNGEERAVPMSPEVHAAIKAHRAARSAEELRTGKRSDWLFVNPKTDRPFREGWIDLRLKRALKRCGLPALSFHSVGRHSWASQMKRAGASGPVVRDLGGWADDTIVNRYSHSVTDGREDVAKLDLLGKTRKPAQTQEGV